MRNLAYVLPVVCLFALTPALAQIETPLSSSSFTRRLSGRLGWGFAGPRRRA